MTETKPAPDAAAIIRALGLLPHPEGGHYAETWRDPGEPGRRGAGTAIYYLLGAGEISAWHRVDATEIWHFHAGSPLVLEISETGRGLRTVILGADVASGERPQAIVPPHAWQSARSAGAWTLVGCTVSPAFEFTGFELAPRNWKPS
jgi:uncharacterized protein